MFWIVGLATLAIVLVRAMRAERRPLALPRPSAGCISTVIAWMVIAIVAVVVWLQQPH